MRRCSRCCAPALILGALILVAGPAVNAAEELPPIGNFSPAIDSTVVGTRLGEIPPNGTIWREYYDRGSERAGRTDHIQTGYLDDGDLMISTGDAVELDGVPHPIQWVGVTLSGQVWWHPEICSDEVFWGVFEVEARTLPSYVDLQLLWPFWRRFDAVFLDIDRDDEFDLGEIIHWGDPFPYCSTGFYISEIDISVHLADFGAVPAIPATWGRIKSLM